MYSFNRGPYYTEQLTIRLVFDYCSCVVGVVLVCARPSNPSDGNRTVEDSVEVKDDLYSRNSVTVVKRFC